MKKSDLFASRETPGKFVFEKRKEFGHAYTNSGCGKMEN
jgi:hypothetical protein